MNPAGFYRKTYFNEASYLEAKKELESSGKTILPFELWKLVNQTASSVINEEILDNEYGFQFPKSLGTLLIIGDKNPRQSIDWVSTRKYNNMGQDDKVPEGGKLIYFNNSKTNGVIYSFKWTRYIRDKKKSNTKNLRLFIFRPSKQLKHMMFERVKEGKFRHWIKLDDVQYSSIKQITVA